MTGFALTAPDRTIFGRDTRFDAAAEAAALGHRILLVRGRSVAWVDELADDLKARGCDTETVVARGEPDLPSLRAALSIARAHRTDCVIAVGGGAVIDLGKALAGLCPSDGDPADHLGLGAAGPRPLSDPLPFVAMPTTAGTGAEATRNAVIGIPDEQRKLSLRDPRLVPKLAIIDPALTDGTPASVTLASGLDAVTQLVESYLCNRANPVTDALCAATIDPATRALRDVMRADQPDARDTLMRAAYLSGLALANSGLGIVHGLASVIGGRGGAHGAICGRLLGSALSVNRQAMVDRGLPTGRVDQVNRWIAAGLGRYGDDAPAALRAFLRQYHLPDLANLGLPAKDYGEVAEATRHASSTQANPVVLTADEIERILELAT